MNAETLIKTLEKELAYAEKDRDEMYNLGKYDKYQEQIGYLRCMKQVLDIVKARQTKDEKASG